MRERVLAARREGACRLMARWEPEKHPDVLALLQRLAAVLVEQLPRPPRRLSAARG